MFDNQSWQICIIMQEPLFKIELSFIVLGQHSFTAGSCWLFTGCSCFWICGSSSFAISLVGNKFHIFHHWLFFFRWKKKHKQWNKKILFWMKLIEEEQLFPLLDYFTHINLSTLTSVCIFSILFSIQFLRCWQGEFV